MHYRAWLIPVVASRLVRVAHFQGRFFVLTPAGPTLHYRAWLIPVDASRLARAAHFQGRFFVLTPAGPTLRYRVWLIPVVASRLVRVAHFQGRFLVLKRDVTTCVDTSAHGESYKAQRFPAGVRLSASARLKRNS